MIIKKPAQRTLSDRLSVAPVAGPLRFGLSTPSFPARQVTIGHAPESRLVSPSDTHFRLHEGSTLGIPMPPPVTHIGRSNARFGEGSGYRHPGEARSPAFAVSGYYTPTQSQRFVILEPVSLWLVCSGKSNYNTASSVRKLPQALLGRSRNKEMRPLTLDQGKFLTSVGWLDHHQ